MKQLLIEQAKLEKLAIQNSDALKRAAADIESLNKLNAQGAALRAARADMVAAAYIKSTVADTDGIDAELATVAEQIAALSDAPAKHMLLTNCFDNVQSEQRANHAAINQIVCDRMQDQFAQARQEFRAATTALNKSLVKMKSALRLTKLFKGNHAQLLGQYQEYAFGLYVRGLPTHDSRDIAADLEASIMLEALGSEGVNVNFER